VSPGKVEDVKFLKGEESLRTFAEMLKSVTVPMQFPPSSQVHVVRRVRVSCGKVSASNSKPKDADKPLPLPGSCTLEWIPTSEVRGLE